MNETESQSPDDAELCTLYLLGELEGQSLARFEQRLAELPELADCLEARAELIDDLSRVRMDVAAVPAAHRTPWTTIAATLALAACLAWALLSLRSDLTDSSGVALDASAMEELLIAKTWADDPGTSLDESEALSDAGDEGFFELDDEVDLDSSLSWMVVAMSAGGELLLEGDGNDG